jgi:hypothetical protein
MASRGLESRLRQLEARHAFSRRRGGVIEVPCEPGQDIDEAAQALGLLDSRTDPVALVPAAVASEKWLEHVAAYQAWMAQHRAGSAETERSQVDAAT